MRSTPQAIEYTIQNHVAVITMNNPPREHVDGRQPSRFKSVGVHA